MAHYDGPTDDLNENPNILIPAKTYMVYFGDCNGGRAYEIDLGEENYRRNILSLEELLRENGREIPIATTITNPKTEEEVRVEEDPKEEIPERPRLELPQDSVPQPRSPELTPEQIDSLTVVDSGCGKPQKYKHRGSHLKQAHPGMRLAELEWTFTDHPHPGQISKCKGCKAPFPNEYRLSFHERICEELTSTMSG